MMRKMGQHGGNHMTFIGILAIVGMSVLTLSCVLKNENEEIPESAYGWTWESGSDSVGQQGIYGTKGTASSSNMPGARGYHSVWPDASGNLWLFGGHGFDVNDASGHLNDLWKFTPSTLEWTWIAGSNVISVPGSYGVRGTAAPDNLPGSRDSYASWIDSAGRLWLFGGFGFDSADSTGHLNDMWMFDPTSLQWTWVSGSTLKDQTGVYGTKGVADAANVPGARFRTVSWRDSEGKFWLFGGSGFDSIGATGSLNDVWRFDPSTLQWTWVSGSELRDQTGVYGTKGTPAPGNFPGGRDASASWRDSAGRTWLFGGEGYDGTGNLGHLSDLWRYDPATLEWTWVSGNTTIDQPGIYGTMGTASSANSPGGNKGASAWLDPSGVLWLFGGTGYDSAGNLGELNALWKYDPVSSQWTWMSGLKTFNGSGDYGTKGKRYLSNTPGGRHHAVSWTASNGDLWLFGGEGLDADGVLNYLNDLWKYKR